MTAAQFFVDFVILAVAVFCIVRLVDVGVKLFKK